MFNAGKYGRGGFQIRTLRLLGWRPTRQLIADWEIMAKGVESASLFGRRTRSLGRRVRFLLLGSLGWERSANSQAQHVSYLGQADCKIVGRGRVPVVQVVELDVAELELVDSRLR